jgi:hypothetical protein
MDVNDEQPVSVADNCRDGFSSDFEFAASPDIAFCLRSLGFRGIPLANNAPKL